MYRLSVFALPASGSIEIDVDSVALPARIFFSIIGWFPSRNVHFHRSPLHGDRGSSSLTMMCCPSDIRYGSVGVPPPSRAPQVFGEPCYFHACSSTGLRSTISSNDISIRDNMSIIGPTSRAIRPYGAFANYPSMIRETLMPPRLISDIILSAPADSDHPLFTFDINSAPRSICVFPYVCFQASLLMLFHFSSQI
jgi:hypothetical protein